MVVINLQLRSQKSSYTRLNKSRSLLWDYILSCWKKDLKLPSIICHTRTGIVECWNLIACSLVRSPTAACSLRLFIHLLARWYVKSMAVIGHKQQLILLLFTNLPCCYKKPNCSLTWTNWIFIIIINVNKHFNAYFTCFYQFWLNQVSRTNTYNLYGITLQCHGWAFSWTKQTSIHLTS